MTLLKTNVLSIHDSNYRQIQEFCLALKEAENKWRAEGKL